MKRALLALAVIVLCAGATEYAMRGRHQATGNAGYLGTESAGVEGRITDSMYVAVLGINNRGAEGHLAEGIHGVAGYAANELTAAGVIGTGYFGVWGSSSSLASGAAGVIGQGIDKGVFGEAQGVSSTSSGVAGTNYYGYGVKGDTVNGTGVYGLLQPGGAGHAAWFEGRVRVVGQFTNTMSSLRIDHPTDPAGKYLTHATVGSSEMKNVYDGVITLDPDGTATVTLPDWFEALNKDFRYQLTSIGEHAPVYIAEEIKENRFRIAGGYAGMKVSWMVTGIRRDPFAETHPVIVEEVKPPHELGRFQHPELYGHPPAARIAPNPERK